MVHEGLGLIRLTAESAARRCVITPGHEVVVSGELTGGESPSVWVHQGFGLTGRVEGGRVPLTGENLTPGLGRVAGLWDGFGITPARPTSVIHDHDAPPVVLTASERLPGPQDLTDTERESAMDEVFSRSGSRLLGFGGTSHSTFACLLFVDSAFVDWWLDVTTLRIDLSVAMLPSSLWDDSGRLPPGVMPGSHARP